LLQPTLLQKITAGLDLIKSGLMGNVADASHFLHIFFETTYNAIEKMPGKTARQFFFEVQLNWEAATHGILSAKDAEGTIRIATSPKLGGKGNLWTPEHLLLSAVSGSFIETYLAYAKKIKLKVLRIECNAIGQIEIIHSKYKFTNINLYPIICIASETLKEKATLALEKTHQNCLVTNSLDAGVFYHSEVLITPKPKKVLNGIEF